ncbi:ImmA/IrrE family metallo-endopeptidase [Lysinibacillus parviboronicapiens]|uniref:ImmA/IrrE family metallo-endopeptidase n=1 Tax=Lysinibacillus parviboronicapiens TaxID=436516 RepID=UPI000D3D6CE5|nr:ImmA/IrrE family metallo-endopeptidase [Lysinibacillus parviboronicapiens]
MTFVYTHLEDYIRDLYISIGVTRPEHLDLKIIATRLGFSLFFSPFDSTNIGNVIFIDTRLSREEQWQEFGHELCHGTQHSGNQAKSPPLFREYQEWKANNFMYHACVPTFMLNKIVLPSNKEKAIFLIQKTFNVEYWFAEKRLDQYLNNHFQSANINIRIYS